MDKFVESMAQVNSHVTEQTIDFNYIAESKRLGAAHVKAEARAVTGAGDPSPAWDKDKLPLPDSINDFRTQSEPVAATNLNGRLHLAISATDSRSSDNRRGGIFVLSSRTGDKWDRTIHVFNNNTNAAAGNVSIACDTTEMIGENKNPFRNHLYAAWTVYRTSESSRQFSEVLFSKSVDGGNTFGTPIIAGWSVHPLRLDIRSKPVQNQQKDQLQNHAGMPHIVSDADVSVDDHGIITVSWKETDPSDGSASMVFRSSANGGESFAAEQRSPYPY